MIKLVLLAYSFFAEHKWILMLLVSSIVLCCTLLLSSVKFEERITFLLPDNQGNLSSDLALLQSTPLQKKLIITLHASNDTLAGEELAAITKKTVSLLYSPLISKATCSVENMNPNVLVLLRDMVPALFSAELEQQIAKQVTPDAISGLLKEHKRTLYTLSGSMLAQTIAADPLNLYVNAFSKLRTLSYLKNLRIQHNTFMTPDGKHSMIMAETSVSSTDSAAAIALEKELSRVEKSLPPGITWSVLGAQRYTAANASIIKKDITKTSIIASITLLLIVLFFLRTKQVFFIILLPVIAYTCGATAVAMKWSPASTMTFGFGPVLAGMAIDFGLHLYYVLGDKTTSKQALLKHAAQPILISGGTTIAAFSLLMFSPVPGLRQLSLFIVVGLIAALLLTVFVLPHVLSGAGSTQSTCSFTIRKKRPVKIIFALILILACFGASQTTVQSHIRDLGVKPERLLSTEATTHSIWGIEKRHAILFAKGQTLDDAIRNTHRGIAKLQKTDIQKSVGLSFVMPQQQLQQSNINRWLEFIKKTNDTSAIVKKEAASLGYSSQAFAPFYAFMNSNPEQITLNTLRRLGFGAVLDTLIIPNSTPSNDVTLLSYLPDNDTVNSTFTPELEKELNLRLVSQSRLGLELSQVLTGTFAKYIGYALCIIILFITVTYRDTKQCICALLPACFGLFAMCGLFGLTNRPFSVFSLAGALLVLGHGVDYGVYATHAIKSGNTSVSQAIFISGLTSLAGFGSLLFAEHPALFDMGLSVFIGLLAAMPCALILLPSLFSKESMS